MSNIFLLQNIYQDSKYELINVPKLLVFETGEQVTVLLGLKTTTVTAITASHHSDPAIKTF